jgi:serine/threonine protein kinase
VTEPVQLPGLTDLHEIGRGGYGVVYRAWQEQLRRQVAVKVLSARLDGGAAHRFAQECRALGTVSGHPHIVTVFDAGTTGQGSSYLVMPFYADGSLHDRLAQAGPMPWPDAVSIGVELAGALQTAHDAGILHRDIKPANVLVDGYGAVRLADFGQARHSTDELTRTAGIVATPGFSAPEILHGDPASARSDVFSLAATVMGLIRGRGPFAGDTDENLAALLLRVVNEPPPDLRALGVPDPICRVLENAMDKRPSLRPATAAEFGEALQAAQRDVGRPPTAMTVARRPDGEPKPGAPAPAAPAVPSTAPTIAASALPFPPDVTPPAAMPPVPESPVGDDAASAATVAYSPPPVPPMPVAPAAGATPFPPPVAPPPAAPSPGYSGQSDPPGRDGRRSRRWLVAVAVVLVVAAGAVIAVVLSRGGKNNTGTGPSTQTDSTRSSSSAPRPRTVTDARQLLITDPSSLGSWMPASGSDPDTPGEWSIFWDLMGSEPDSDDNPSPVPDCLGLPARPAGSQRNVSDVFVAQGGAYSPTGKYLIMQTAGFVMPSAATAKQMVAPWQTKLTACERQIAQWASYDDFAWVNHEKSDLPTAAEPVAPNVVFTSPPVGVELPSAVTASFVRIQYQLRDKPQYQEVPPRYFDLITLAAGASVVYLVLQGNGDPPDDSVRVAAVQQLLAKLVS